MNYKIILLVFKNVKFGVILKSSRTIILSILIILAFSLSLGAISAQAIDDDSTGIMIDVDEETEDIGNIDSLSSNDNSLDDVDGPDIISAANDEISISDDGEDNTSDIGTFYELRTSIRISESNLTLEKDYNFTSSSTSGITIDKDFTINGNGHYIDSQGLSRIFNINGTTLILNNIVFISSQGADAGYSSLDIEGGAIFARNSNLVIENCSFDSFNANFGGAICALDTNLTLNNVSFSNCSSKYYGGAVYQMYGNLNASSSSFANCSAIDGAGIFADDLDSVNISNTGFYENNASLLGGAIFSNENENMIIEDCTFDSNTEAYDNKSYVDDNGDAHVLNYYGENLVADASGYTGYDVYNQAKYDLYIFYDNDYELFYNDGTILNEFPESYDLRNVSNVSFVTNVKNQGNGGNCWSFSAMAALESAILKATNGAVSLDLSEENMKNLMACFSPFGTTYETNTGGNDRLSNAYLAAGLGPVLESLDNYVPKDYLSAIFNPLTHIQNILWIDRNDYLDNDGIKFALLNYGAVYVSCYFSSSLANGPNYYYTGTKGRNHAVTIVGWNDTYSASNFKTTPPGDGAWIVKNSWGTGSGKDGYYYVSYYDTRFAIGHQECFCFVLNNSVKYRKTYQYDIVGMSDWLYNESASNGIWYKNVFNSTDDEVLAAFSTYFNEKTNYTAYVYVNGELVNVQEGSAHNGYCTIKLSKYIFLKKGDKFEIVLNVRSDDISIIPISESSSSKRDYALEGVSFFSFDGESWEDLYNYSGEYYENGNRTHWYNLTKVACLKAFTISKAVVNLTVQTPIDFRAIILDEFGDLVNYGLFNITNGDREYLIDANTNLTIAFNEKGTYRIFYTKFNDLISDYDFDKTIEIGKLNVVAFPTSVSFEDNLLENYSTQFNVSVIDCYGNPVPDGVVYFEILDSNGVSMLNHTSNRNDFTFDCYLEPGVYRILFKFTSTDEDYHNASLNGKFRVKNLTSLSLSLKNITYGEMENITCVLDIGDVNLTFTVNGSNGYSEVFNSSDSLNLSDLDVGIYDVHVRFNGNEDYAHNSTSGSFVVNPMQTNIRFEDSLLENYDTHLNVCITDGNGNTVPDGVVSFEILDSNGDSVLNHTLNMNDLSFDCYLDPGVYRILFKFTSANDNYLNAYLNGSFKVRNLTSISLSLKDIIYGEMENITSILNINGVNLTYVINGSNGYEGVFNSSDSLILSDLEVGTYDVHVRFNGNEDYAHNSTSASFVVGQRPSGISYSYAKIYAYPNSEYFIITLMDSVTGNALLNKQVQYKFNNGKVATVKTDANGVVKIKISVSKYGNYAMQVNFLGDEHYKASSISKTIKVYKNSVKFTGATKKVKKAKSKRTFKITLKTSNNKVLKSKYVYLTINKKTYKVKTNSKGVAAFKIKLPKVKKTYKYKVKFKGDNGNYAKTYSAKLKVY